MFDKAQRASNQPDKRLLIIEELDEKAKAGGYYLTDIFLVDDQHTTIMALEAITGHRRDAQGNESSTVPRREKFKLRTLDGQPLGRVRVGVRPMRADQIRLARLRGEDEDVYEEYPAEFECSGPEAAMLLSRYGYGISWPKTTHEASAIRKDKDSRGEPVVPNWRWRLVEVGHPMEKKAQADYDAFAKRHNLKKGK